jgi:hypothetical protein
LSREGNQTGKRQEQFFHRKGSPRFCGSEDDKQILGEAPLIRPQFFMVRVTMGQVTLRYSTPCRL